MTERPFKARWQKNSPMTKEDMEMEIAFSNIVDPYVEFDDQTVKETLKALNLEDNNVRPTTD